MIDLDIPDRKRRLFKEAFELFRRACNLQDAVHQLDMLSSFIKPDEAGMKRKLFYNAAIMGLEKERDEVIEAAIERYQAYKKENGLQSDT